MAARRRTGREPVPATLSIMTASVIGAAIVVVLLVVLVVSLRALRRESSTGPTVAATPPGVDLDTVSRHAAEGNTIQAIKEYRQLTGASLADAKRAVERLARGDAPDARPDLSEVRRLVADGRKIQAIKVYRQRTGASLADAKAAVENGNW